MNDEFKEILDQIAATPSIAPPENFTENVMRSVLSDQTGGLDRPQQILPRLGGRLFASRGLLSPASTRGECAFYYIMAGIFYAVIGIILMFGLHGIQGVSIMDGWLRMQPFFIVAASMWLIGLGAALYLAGHSAALYAKIGSLIFIFAFLLNCLGSYVHPYLFVSYIAVILTSTSVIMGLLLYRNAADYSKTLNQGGA